MAGLLHDVGKVGIPDEILRKPGRLTDEEYDVMKQHPVVGAMIVSSMPGFQEIIPGVRNHHERWDGTGYPDGLAGEAIPLLGRLLAVPDTMSAMTTDRPYRKGLTWEAALEEVERKSGTQFDPSIVAAFLSAEKKHRTLAKREGDSLDAAA
jgi:HD-GYP domain-containing protein (c-di-GMP phosphodiesterase class II)